MRYNTFYKDPYYYANKFPNPKAFMNLPGAYDIVNEMVENSKSPLEEILMRQSYLVKEISNDNINIEVCKVCNIKFKIYYGSLNTHK